MPTTNINKINDHSFALLITYEQLYTFNKQYHHDSITTQLLGEYSNTS